MPQRDFSGVLPDNVTISRRSDHHFVIPSDSLRNFRRILKFDYALPLIVDALTLITDF